jgi:hypothetical protein
MRNLLNVLWMFMLEDRPQFVMLIEFYRIYHFLHSSWVLGFWDGWCQGRVFRGSILLLTIRLEVCVIGVEWRLWFFLVSWEIRGGVRGPDRLWSWSWNFTFFEISTFNNGFDQVRWLISSPIEFRTQIPNMPSVSSYLICGVSYGGFECFWSFKKRYFLHKAYLLFDSHAKFSWETCLMYFKCLC